MAFCRWGYRHESVASVDYYDQDQTQPLSFHFEYNRMLTHKEEPYFREYRYLHLDLALIYMPTMNAWNYCMEIRFNLS